MESIAKFMREAVEQIIGERVKHRIRMSIRWTPFCTDDIVGQVGADVTGVFSTYHFYIKAAKNRFVRKLLQYFQMSVCLSDPEVALPITF